MTKRRWSSLVLLVTLRPYEIERKVRKEKTHQKKKTLTFKSTPTIFDENEEEKDDEDLPS